MPFMIKLYSELLTSGNKKVTVFVDQVTNFVATANNKYPRFG